MSLGVGTMVARSIILPKRMTALGTAAVLLWWLRSDSAAEALVALSAGALVLLLGFRAITRQR